MIFVLFTLCCAQTFTGSYVKYDYCATGSKGCMSSNCGGSVGECIADAYILLHNCTASGLGMNQPAYDGAVVSSYQCGSEGLRTNYSSFQNCASNQSPLLPIQTTFSSLGYSSFCWGGSVTCNNRPFGQFNLTRGYSLITTYSCPSGSVTTLTFVEDPSPHNCVSDDKVCTSSSPQFIVSTTCYNNGTMGATAAPLSSVASGSVGVSTMPSLQTTGSSGASPASNTSPTNVTATTTGASGSVTNSAAVAARKFSLFGVITVVLCMVAK